MTQWYFELQTLLKNRIENERCNWSFNQMFSTESTIGFFNLIKISYFDPLPLSKLAVLNGGCGTKQLILIRLRVFIRARHCDVKYFDRDDKGCIFPILLMLRGLTKEGYNAVGSLLWCKHISMYYHVFPWHTCYLIHKM